MSVYVSVKVDQAGLTELLRSPTGPVAFDLTRRANRVKNKARQLCPVDTGKLRASIDYEIRTDSGGLTARVGTNVEYGIFIERGTRYMRAQPFLGPALAAAG